METSDSENSIFSTDAGIFTNAKPVKTQENKSSKQHKKKNS